MVGCMLRHHRPRVGALGDLCSLENDRGESQGQLRNGGPRPHPLDEGAEDLDPICCPGLWTSSKRELLGTFTCSALASHLGAMILPIGLPAGLPEGWVLHTPLPGPSPPWPQLPPPLRGRGLETSETSGTSGTSGQAEPRPLCPGSVECGWLRATGLAPSQQVSGPAQNAARPPRPGQVNGGLQPTGPQPPICFCGVDSSCPTRREAFSGLCPAFVSGPECHLPASWRRGFRNHRARHAGAWNPERADDIPKATQRGGRLPTLRRAPCPARPPHCPLHRAKSSERRCESPPPPPAWKPAPLNPALPPALNPTSLQLEHLQLLRTCARHTRRPRVSAWTGGTAPWSSES